MPKYQGHRSWAYWNVSLWIGNDKGLYRLALECIHTARSRKEAAQRMYEILGVSSHTPDGAKYSVDKIMAAMRGLS